MAAPVRLVPFGASATSCLVEAVRAAKADPLERVTIAVPSSYVGITLRRTLAAELGGLVDVHVVPLAAIFEALGGPRLAARGSRPASAPLRAGALRQAMLERGGVLAQIANHHASQERVARAIVEVRGGGEEVLSALRRAGGSARDVVELAERTRTVLAGFHDDTDLTVAAMEALRAGDPAIAELGTVIVHLPIQPDHCTTAALRALVREADATVHLGLTGNPEIDDVTRDLAAQLGPHEEVGAAPQPEFQIIGAPDPAAEVETALRVIAEALDAGTPLHRMAIVYRLSSPYARIVGETVDAVGWRWSGPSPLTLGDTVAGRALTGVLTLVEHDVPRDAFAAFLAAAPVVASPDGDEAPAHRWDVLTREAGIVGGLDQWSERLAAHATRLQSMRDDRLARDELSEASVARIESDLIELKRIDAFIRWLVELTATSPTHTWEGYARWVRGLLDALIPADGWPDAEARARDDLLVRVDGLGALDTLPGPPPTFEEFRRALTLELATPLGPTGRVGDGLLVLPARAAVGLSVDLVVVVGANEGRFPPRGNDDPFLPNTVRAASGLPTRQDRLRREEIQRDAVLAAAPKVIVTWARSDPRAGRAMHPSRWLVRLAQTVLDSPVTADELAARTTGPAHTIVSYAALVASGPGSPIDLAGYDLASLTTHAPMVDDHPAFAHNPRLAAALTALRARLDDRFTPFDGLVGSLDDLLPDPNRELSPTSLEHWASCPRRYLFERILRAGVVERPESVDDISPMDRGTLVHTILERFVGERPTPIRPGEAWTPADLERLETIMREEFEQAKSAGLTGRPLLWKLSERRIRGWVQDWLRTDEATRAQYGVVPDRFELGFGGSEHGDDEAVVVELDNGHRFRMRGKIDRIDRSPDGTTVVVHDYKTGNTDRYTKIQPRKPAKNGVFDPTLSGTALQLPVYALAARQHYPEATLIHTDYWVVGGKNSGRQIGYDFDDRHESEFRRVMGHIATGIASGVFPGDPGEEDFYGFKHCQHCAFDRVCPRDRDEQFLRKMADETLAPYRSLAPVAEDSELDDPQSEGSAP